MSFSKSWPRFYCGSCNTEIKDVFDVAPGKRMGWACQCTTRWTGLDSIPLDTKKIEEQVEKAGELGKAFGSAMRTRCDKAIVNSICAPVAQSGRGATFKK